MGLGPGLEWGSVDRTKLRDCWGTGKIGFGMRCGRNGIWMSVMRRGNVGLMQVNGRCRLMDNGRMLGGWADHDIASYEAKLKL